MEFLLVFSQLHCYKDKKNIIFIVTCLSQALNWFLIKTLVSAGTTPVPEIQIRQCTCLPNYKFFLASLGA